MTNGSANRAPSNATLNLTVLGGASLSYLLPNKELTPVLGPGKPLALLAYLTRLPNRTATRNHVLDLLWSNQDPSMAKPALRQAIWYIRQRIGNDGVESGDGVIKLVVPIDSDVDRFESAVDDGDLERAVDLYGGPFLPDLAVPGGAEFEHWAIAERARIESMYLRTSEVVIRSWLSQGKFQKAEQLARYIRDMNRERQAWWRLLLEVLTSSGDAVRASVEAGDLERSLEAEGLSADRATVEAIRLARQMPASNGEPTKNQSLVAELVGREREFATILRAWEDANNGAGHHLTVIAGAGLGKTRLLTDVHMRLHASGVEVIHLRANVGERQIGFSLASNLAGMLSQLPGAKGVPPACAATLVALNPSLSSRYEVHAESIKDRDVLRIRTIALCELLAAVAHEQPIAMLIDDLHWIDDSSIQVLGGIAGSINDTPAMLVTASRPTARGPIQDSAQEEIRLTPLSLEQVSALVSSIGTLPDDGWVRPAIRALRDENGGSPLLVLESLQLAIDRGSLELREGGWFCNDGNLLVSEFQQGGALRRRVAKLDRSESWALLILAVAGMPLSVNQIARMTGRSEQMLFPALVSLEQRGFIARVENEMEPAHDEIAALAIELAAEDAGPAASGAVGRVLAEDASDNEHLLLRAGQLLASAADRSRLCEVFKKRLWMARSRGDSRRTRDLAKEMLGHHYSVDASKVLFRSLPFHFRLGLTSARRVVGAASAYLFVCAAVITVLLWPAGRAPDVAIIAYDRTVGPNGQPIGARVWRDEFTSLEAIELRRTDHAPRIDSIHGDPIASPDGTMWAFNRLKGDSGEIDVFVVDSDGNERRLTHTPNDDGIQDWSPDGRYVLIVSSRWHPEELYEAATVNVATGDVFRLTDSPHSESILKWSPDGTRIGYHRSELGTNIVDFCWTTPRADPPVCIRRIDWFTGWHGANDVLVTIDSAGERWFGRLNLEEERFYPIIPLGAYRRFFGSRDGQWILGSYQDSLLEHTTWRLIPIDAPDMAVNVSLPPGNTDGYVLALQPVAQPDNYLNILKIDGPAIALPVGVPLLLNASGLDKAGRRIPLTTLEWSGHETDIATVHPRGVLYPHQPGTATIHTTAGGWRADSTAIQVADSGADQTFAERWTDDWIERWDSYGDPHPRVIAGPDSTPAFWNNGDRAFTSGAYSREEWNAQAGLGVEAFIANTITRPHQQTMVLSLSGWINPVVIADWNHKDGYLPGRASESRPEHCGFSYPNTNAVLDGEVSLQVGRWLARLNAGLPVHSGEWHRVLVQIFPDGTCGIAVNGRPIARSSARVPLDMPYRVWTEGRSIGEEMLVGPLEVWTGVNTDIDWASLDWPPGT